MNYKFDGYIAEARIWKRALSEAEVQSSFRTSGLATGDGLVGSWMLNDGFGMRARDVSPFAHPGTLSRGCRWKEATRPIDVPPAPTTTDANGVVQPAVAPPYMFDLLAFVYTNGDCIVILYRREAFSGVHDGLFQVFNVDSGQLVQEALHTYCGDSLSAAFDPKVESYFVHQTSSGVFHKYRSRRPNYKAAWRLARTKDEDKSGSLFPTPTMFKEKYPLPTLYNDDGTIAAQTEAKALAAANASSAAAAVTPAPSSGVKGMPITPPAKPASGPAPTFDAESDPDSVDLPTIIAALLGALGRCSLRFYLGVFTSRLTCSCSVFCCVQIPTARIWVRSIRSFRRPCSLC